MGRVTIFKNIFDKQPFYISAKTALHRIQSGVSKERVQEIRTQLDKERQNQLKCNLPSVCFSGEFERREDAALLHHSGLICLDFDLVEDIPTFKEILQNTPFIYAYWLSPRANGIKALVKIADGSKHRAHFKAIKEHFPDVDASGVNESRVCYESYDPDLYFNEKAEVFTKTVETEQITRIETVSTSESFQNILKWLTNRGDAFVKGERNTFMFKLASACCRFGVTQDDCELFCQGEFGTGDDFRLKELVQVIKSAYKRNATQFGSAQFEREHVVDKTTRKEIILEANPDEPARDVIFGEDVKAKAIEIFENGYAFVLGIDVPSFDHLFRLNKKDLTLLTGIGNYGKSTFLKWFLLMRILLYKEKFAFFSPEEMPAEEFYHGICEIYFGTDLTPQYNSTVNKDQYNEIYDWVSKHIFLLYPKKESPSPEYLCERFLELIIKEKIDGFIIDPFNQMYNDYRSEGGRSDKYLERVLTYIKRFQTESDVYAIIVAHPHGMKKGQDGNYPCPDVMDIADGAMWNNKMDNIIVYHKPYHQTDPMDYTCEFHSKKIRRQKTTGKRGSLTFAFIFKTRRFLFNGFDPMEALIRPEQPKTLWYDDKPDDTNEIDKFFN